MRLGTNITLLIRPSCRLPLATEGSDERELDTMDNICNHTPVRTN